MRLKTGRVISYTPEQTENWEDSIRGQAISCRPEKLLDGPLALELTIYVLRPKSRPKKCRYPDRRPDHDNYIKSVKGALNGITWRDDALIVGMVARKRYGNPPRTEVVVEELRQQIWREV